MNENSQGNLSPSIIGVSHRARAFGDAGMQGENIRGVYQLGSPFQLSSTQVGLSLNIRYSGIRAVDLEIGSDLAIFDDINHISDSHIQELTRYSHDVHPKTGRKMLFARYPVIINFVPFGAKRPDGTPHPFAGTGFGINSVIGFPEDRLSSDVFEGMEDDEQFYAVEIHQYTYDGTHFREVSGRMYRPDELLDGFLLGGGAMSTAIADGDDLILPLSGMRNSGSYPIEINGCGLVRFRCTERQWKAVEYVPVIADTEHFYSIGGTFGNYVEPSVMRDLDGSLLFVMREVGEKPFAAGPLDAERLRVFRSADNGRSWETMIDLPHFHPLTPLSIIRAADGTPCICANEYCTKNSKGEVKGSIVLRERMLLHELSPDRSDLLKPLMVRDCVGEFPAPYFDSWWRIDHPIGLPVRLKDGRWHGLLCYRILEHAECDLDAPLTPLTGCYVEEIYNGGDEVPLWFF